MAHAETPGLQRRANKDGTSRVYWHARTDIKKLGYQPAQVRLDGNLPETQWPAECQRLQAAMLKWASDRKAACVYDGTVSSLVNWYLNADDSPFHEKRPETQKGYRKRLKQLVAAKGKLLIEEIHGADVRRWYKDMLDGGLDRSTAHVHVKTFKVVVGFGSSNGIEACERLRNKLRDTRFEGGEKRRVQLTREHLTAFVPKALELGRPSLALALSLQFWLGMRQKDVIGEWLQMPGADGIRDHRGWRWANGLTGMLFDDDGNIRKKTTKTGTEIEHSIANYPELVAMVKQQLARDRGGPLVVNEWNGLPYHLSSFQKTFRRIARKAGIPNHVYNMDARAGAITEALSSGAVLQDVMAFAGHTRPETTLRYLREVSEQSGRVAKRRIRGRE